MNFSAPVRIRDDAQLRQIAKLLSSIDPWKKLGITEETNFLKLAKIHAEVFAIIEKGVVAGAVALYTEGAFTGYIFALAAAPEFSKMGVGSTLLSFAEQYLFRRFANVFLCVSEFNTGAQQFYRKHGYRQVGMIPDYLVAGENELLFRKQKN